jgi:hypothetical protein
MPGDFSQLPFYKLDTDQISNDCYDSPITFFIRSMMSGG